MITIGIIGILAMTAIPKFGGMIRTAKDGDVRSKLGIIRSALNIYFAITLPISGRLGGPKPNHARHRAGAKICSQHARLFTFYPSHDSTTATDNAASSSFGGTVLTCHGRWVYVCSRTSTDWGIVAVSCYHSDYKGAVWTTY